MMSTSRAHYVLPSKASQENRVKKKAKQITRDQHSAGFQPLLVSYV